MNWYHKILLVLLGFVSMMTYFIVRSVNTKIDLVTENYYEAELHHQDKIDSKKNAEEMSEKVQIKINEQKARIQFPQETREHSIQGTISFYCPSNKSNDETIDIQLNDTLTQFIDVSKHRGLYTVLIQWTMNDKSYTVEKKIYI
ncbi:MAG: FixH family protein [Chitinophagaceae bacterium]